MRNRLFLWLFVLLISCLSACNPIIDSDRPPRNSEGLKGPQVASLPQKTFTLTELVTFPSKGLLSRSSNSLLLAGYNWKAALVEPSGVISLADRPVASSLYADESGTIWATTNTYPAVGKSITTIYRYESTAWMEYATLENVSYPIRVTADEFWFYTNSGLLIWDVWQRKTKQLIMDSHDRQVTRRFSFELSGTTLSVYGHQNPSTSATQFDLSQYITVRQNISHTILRTYEEGNGQVVWLVVKDADWDGALLKYDGQTLQPVTHMPVGYLSSSDGRSVSNFAKDKVGNLWLNIDAGLCLYTKEGNWLRPTLADLKQGIYYGFFTDAQGQLLLHTEEKLYLVNVQ